MARSSALSAEPARTIQHCNPPSGGWQIYSAWCLGVAFCLSYSFPFVTLSLCDGDEASPSVLSVEPALCRSALHPPSPGRWQPCSARGTGFASPPQCRSALNLAADSLLRYGVTCDIQYYINHTWGCLIPGLMRVTLWWGETKPSALSVVPAWAVQHCTPSRGGWQAFAAFHAWVSPPSLLVAIVLPWVCFILRLHSLRRSPFSTLLSPRYQASHSRGVRMVRPSPLSAGPSQCCSVLHPFSDRVADLQRSMPRSRPASPVAGNARATSRLSCPLTC